MEALKSLQTHFVMDLAFLTGPDVEGLVLLVGGGPNGGGRRGFVQYRGLTAEAQRGRSGRCQRCKGECLLGFRWEWRLTAQILEIGFQVFEQGLFDAGRNVRRLPAPPLLHYPPGELPGGLLGGMLQSELRGVPPGGPPSPPPPPPPPQPPPPPPNLTLTLGGPSPPGGPCDGANLTA